MKTAAIIALACVCFGCTASTDNEVADGVPGDAAQLDSSDATNALDASDKDSGDSDARIWECNGDDGPLTCDHPRASPLRVSRFDPTRACFEPIIELPDLCAVDTYCHAVSGAFECIAAADGELYAAFVLLGDQLTDSYSANLEAEMTLTDSQSDACAAMYEALDGSDEILIAMFQGKPLLIGPACP
jgi:hypothetical protein